MFEIYDRAAFTSYTPADQLGVCADADGAIQSHLNGKWYSMISTNFQQRSLIARNSVILIKILLIPN